MDPNLLRVPAWYETGYGPRNGAGAVPIRGFDDRPRSGSEVVEELLRIGILFPHRGRQVRADVVRKRGASPVQLLRRVEEVAVHVELFRELDVGPLVEEVEREIREPQVLLSAQSVGDVGGHERGGPLLQVGLDVRAGRGLG